MTMDAKTNKKEILKDIIRELHRGGDVEELRKRFAELVRNGNAQAAFLVGATAAGKLLADPLAQQILAQRAARDQPSSTPFAEPVATK